MKFDPPQLRVGGLSGRVYVITHGKEIDTASGPGIEATRKYDVTDQFEAVAHERGWTPPDSKHPQGPESEGD